MITLPKGAVRGKVNKLNAQPVEYRTKAFEARTLAFIFLIALQLTAYASPSASAKPATPAPVSATGEAALATPPVAALGDPQELATFVDGVMNKQLEELHIAGAVVVIVKDGQVLLAKGYGYADVEKRIPVDAEHTLFRPGSVTKLFTWTAVMQMVEQGKIDLQADVNTYLTDFQIPATYPQPVTMLDLMAHTSGFGEISAGVRTYMPEELTSLGVYLARYMPGACLPARSGAGLLQLRRHAGRLHRRAGLR